MSIRILIADDHPIVRQGLKQILVPKRDFVVGGEAENGNQVLQMVRAESWDVIVLDLNMPEPSGVELIKQLKTEKPKLPILVLSVYPEDQFAIRVLKAGASGYMTKDSAPEELVSAIRKVVSGGQHITPSLAEKLAEQLRGKGGETPHTLLSDREFQVLRMIATGKTVSEIAKNLGLSVKTISTHRAHVLDKLKMKTNAELMRYAMENKLVD